MGVLKVLTGLGWVPANDDSQVLQQGENIIISNNQISVNTTNVIEQGNTHPITSDAVYQAIGNIEELLKII